MNLLVITADDFGLAKEVNDAVEIGHRQGVLSAVSLMVAAPWAEDAVERARAMPRLRVGLHLALTDASPALPPGAIPDLVDKRGRLKADLARFGMRLALSSRARRQMRAEIRAQFDAFRATGLTLDHVSVHQHYHLHPVVAMMVVEIAAQCGARALRTPVEAHRAIGDIGAGAVRELPHVERVCSLFLRTQARRAGMLTPDAVFGRRWSGAMTAERLLALLKSRSPEGLCEIYMHPATRDEFPGHAPGYRYADELAALIAPETMSALRATGRALGGYQDVAVQPGDSLCGRRSVEAPVAHS